MSELAREFEAALVVGEEKAVAEAKRWNRIGYAVLAGTFGVAVLWSSLAPLSSAVVAQGAVKVDSSKVKADSKTKVTAKVKATSNNKLAANRTKATAKVKTSSNNKVTAMVTNHAQTVEARDILTLTVKRHHTRLGTRLRKTLLKKLAAKWLQLMQPNRLLQTQFRTPLRCLASQLRASSRAALLPATSSTASCAAAVSQVSSPSVLSL